MGNALAGDRRRKCPHCASIVLRAAEPLTHIFLWLHMVRRAPGEAWPVQGLEDLYDVREGRDVFYTDGLRQRAHLSPADMATLYQLWDTLLYLSGGEGFGVPAWEAMCSCLPVIYTRYSSHGLFLDAARAGLGVGGLLVPEPGSCLLRLIPDVRQAIYAIRRLYYDRALAVDLGTRGRAFVENYGPRAQAAQWDRLFDECLLAGAPDRVAPCSNSAPVTVGVHKL